ASRIAGPGGSVVFGTAPVNDATELIFGIAPRLAQGADASPARIIGSPDLRNGINLAASHVLSLAIGDGPFIEIDARAKAADVTSVKLDELCEAINHAIIDAVNSAKDSAVASHDGVHLILTTPYALELRPVEQTRRRRFVTRAAVLDEAAMPVFG